MRFNQVIPYLPSMLQGALLTVSLALGSLAVAVAFGLVGAALKTSDKPVFVSLASIYSTVVRGIPELIWIFFTYYGIQMLINAMADRLEVVPVSLSPFIAGVLTLGFVYGAFFTETFRGAILSIPHGQFESARAYGMNGWQVFSRITFPQLMRYALPGIRNNWLALTKATALVSVIGLTDVVRIAQQAGASQSASFAFNCVSALMFLVLTSASFIIFNKLEKRFSRGMKGLKRG